ncbi:MAG TPA: T9SS type A sorting domain-containing protein, partial [Chitinophagales bacterium]|nr:T9SS type A sorting domain-containing protein [Chitinophagales bacterium]
ITVVPGTILENQISYAVMGTPCNTLYPKAQYLARNGRIGGNTSFGPTYIFDVPNVLGLVQAPTLKTITGQDGFSRFRLFGATDDNTSLPVELLSFTLTPINNQYFLLNWETASEFNNAGFYVQRSTDRSNFENIAWIAGNGTTNQAQQYTYADRNVEQNITYYYRLQQIDINHAYKYSNILSGRLIGTAFEVTDVHPNPSTVNPQVDVYAPNNGLLQTSIIDVLGREVGHQNFELNRSINALTLNLSYLAKASYLLRFNYDNHLITKKFIKN